MTNQGRERKVVVGACRLCSGELGGCASPIRLFSFAMAMSRLERLVETSSTFFKKHAFSPWVRGSGRGEERGRKTGPTRTKRTYHTLHDLESKDAEPRKNVKGFFFAHEGMIKIDIWRAAGAPLTSRLERARNQKVRNKGGYGRKKDAQLGSLKSPAELR